MPKKLRSLTGFSVIGISVRLAAPVVLLAAVAFATTTADAAPQTPVFGPAIDAYASSDPEDSCDPVAKPGVLGVRDLFNRTYGARTAYIIRACSVGTSEHEEGRALDYMLNVNNAAERAIANDILGWLLATDQHGNRHAMARRLGVMYIIWNRQIWGSYRANEGWRPYTGSNPHTDHIHISFSWAGARKQTTWWTSGATPPVPAEEATQVRADFTGDGKTDIGLLYNYPNGRTALFVAVSTGTGFSWPQIWWDSGTGTFDWARVKLATGDFNGDRKADAVLLYNYGNARTAAFVATSTGTGFNWPANWWDSGNGTFDWGNTKLTTGDFNGDGRTDVSLLYNYGSARTAAFVATSTGTGFNWPANWWDSGTGTFDWSNIKVTAGDFNGDGRTDVGMLYNYGSARSAAFIATSTGTAFSWPANWWDSGNGTFEWGNTKLTAGDFNGDGRTDVSLLYNYGNARTAAFVATSTGTGLNWPANWWDSGNGTFEWGNIKLTAGDFNGDGRTDVGMLFNYGNARTAAFVAASTGTAFSWPANWWDSGNGTFDWTAVKFV